MVTDDALASKSPPLPLPPLTSGPVVLSDGTTGGDPMDVDGQQEEFDPGWPPGWDEVKKATIPPVQRPFSSRQWDLFRKLLKDLESLREAILDNVMGAIIDSIMLDLDHLKQDNTVLLKELIPSKLQLLYK